MIDIQERTPVTGRSNFGKKENFRKQPDGAVFGKQCVPQEIWYIFIDNSSNRDALYISSVDDVDDIMK